MKNSNKLKSTINWVILVVFLLMSHVSNAAVSAPDLRCVSVGPTGLVTLTWVAPSDPANEFLNYIVYSSNTIGGPYTPTTLAGGIATTSFTDVLNANGSSLYYYMETRFDDGSGPTNSLPSVTAQTMLPIFAATTDSTCTLTWDPLFSPNTPTSTAIYTVYRRIGVSGPLVNIGTANYGTETYNDSFKVCSDSIFYRVNISDQNGCVSRSAILKGLFEDKTAPAPPVIDSITVNPATKQVDLVWKPSSSPDTDGYIIFWYEKLTSGYLQQAVQMGRFNTSYTETAAAIDPELDNQLFTVAAFDSCTSNPNTSAGVSEQRTVFLDIVPNNCENTVTLNWTPYIGWLDLAGYEILVSVNNGPYTVAVSLADTDTTFTYTKASNLDVYCYKVRAFNLAKSRTSTSNEVCALSNALLIPKKQYFKQITVEDNSSMHIVSLTDTTLPIEKYVLMRSLEPVFNFYEVDRIKSPHTEIIELNDYEANVTETPYFYRIGMVDTCGNITYVSNPAGSMFLEGNMSNDSLMVDLHWNAYTSWDTVNSGVANYNIFQVLDGKRTLLTTVDKNTLDYQFTISNTIEDGANFCFEIEAREDSGNVFNQADTALSNRVCFTRNLNVFVPNAFRPNGTENLCFKPVISFGNLSTYQMIIYDRWGQTVFESNNIEEGWDGNSNGKVAPFGAYVYYIKISNYTGSTFTKKGTFVLLR